MAYATKNRVLQELVVAGRDLRSGQVIANVLHYKVDDPAVGYDVAVGASTSTNMLDAFKEAWRTVIAQVSLHYVVTSYTIREIIGKQTIAGKPRLTFRGLDFLLADPALDVGGIAGECLPPMNSISVRKGTNTSGRSYRGAMRLALVNESKQSNGALIAAYRAIMQAEMDAFITGMDVGGTMPAQAFYQVVFARTPALLLPDGIWLAARADALTARVTSAPVNPNVGTQQSRKPRQTQLIDQTA